MTRARRALRAAIGLVAVVGLTWSEGAPVSGASSGLTSPPSVLAWGAGLTAPAHSAIDLVVVPHPDDEGDLWAAALNDHGRSFPVFVILTNGENAGACAEATNAAILPAPVGHLGPQDRPPFNTAGDIPGAVGGSVGPGLPPEAFGAQGDDPPYFPRDPPLDPATGWGPLEGAGSFTTQSYLGQQFSEGFAGPCRAARLASLTVMLSAMNAAVARLGPVADRSFFPSVGAGQPPDGQACFGAPQPEQYVSRAGAYSTPDPSGTALVQPTPPGLSSGKDPCAYYWLTGTGDVFAFNLGDMSEGFRAPCASSLGGMLRQGPAWPAGSAGYDSVGAFPDGARPGDPASCAGGVPGGQETYGVTPSDVVWAIQAVASSGRLPAGLAVASLEGASFVNGFIPGPSPSSSVGALDVEANRPEAPCRYLTLSGYVCGSQTPTAPACPAYNHSSHLAVGLALQWNQPLPGVAARTAVCGGDPMAQPVFGTTSAPDGSRFWTQVYDYDGGSGWEAAPQAYAWLAGPGSFDPYGPVTDTCPGSAAVAALGQTQWSCQEAVTTSGGGGSSAPGDQVTGMSNTLTSFDGTGMTPGL